MDEEQNYFPTLAYNRAVALMRALLVSEKDRLDNLASRKGRTCALDEDDFSLEIPNILNFCENYQNYFMKYLAAVLPQHKNGVQCKAGCGNCCHHYPMSLEPFELVRLYSHIRLSPDLISFCEACFFRAKRYHSLLSSAEKAGEEDPEDKALVSYFGMNLNCPFILKSGSCGVYEYRPVTCRMYFSETPSEYCVPEHLLTDKNRSFIVYLPDDIEALIADVSAHYKQLSLPESLYEGILAMNSREPAFAGADEE